MGVSQRHACLAVSQQFRDHGQRDALHDGLGGMGMPQIMQPDVSQLGSLPCHVPEVPEGTLGAGPARVSDGRKDVRAFQTWLPRDQHLRIPAQIHRPRPGLAVAQREDILAHFAPLQAPDFTAPAARQQKQADDVGAWLPRRPLGHARIQGLMEEADFIPRQEAGHSRSGVPLHPAGGVGGDMAADECVVHDPRQGIERAVGAARRCAAVTVEPADDGGAGYPVQRQRAEGRKQLGLQMAVDGLLR